MYLKSETLDDVAFSFGIYESFEQVVLFFEDIMGFKFDDYYCWSQFAYSLASSKKYDCCIRAINEAIAIDPSKCQMYLLGAKVSLNNMNNPSLCLTYCEKSLELFSAVLNNEDDSDNDEANAEEQKDKQNHHFTTLLKVRALIFKGEALLRIALSDIGKKKQDHYIEALYSFFLAKRYSNDSYILFNIALTTALLRDISSSLKYIREALKLNVYRGDYWHLYTLVLSANKDSDLNYISSAIQAATIGEFYCPRCINLYLAHAKLLMASNQPNKALELLPNAFELDKNLRDDIIISDSDEVSSAHSLARNLNNDEKRSIKGTLPIFDTSVQENGEDLVSPYLWSITSDAFAQNGQFEEAISCSHSAQRILINETSKSEYNKSKRITLADEIAHEGKIVEMQQLANIKLPQDKSKPKVNPLDYYHNSINLDPMNAQSLIRLAKAEISLFEKSLQAVNLKQEKLQKKVQYS